MLGPRLKLINSPRQMVEWFCSWLFAHKFYSFDAVIGPRHHPFELLHFIWNLTKKVCKASTIAVLLSQIWFARLWEWCGRNLPFCGMSHVNRGLKFTWSDDRGKSRLVRNWKQVIMPLSRRPPVPPFIITMICHRCLGAVYWSFVTVFRWKYTFLTICKD